MPQARFEPAHAQFGDTWETWVFCSQKWHILDDQKDAINGSIVTC